jgi:DNA-binding MarR family transcriptional regulator
MADRRFHEREGIEEGQSFIYKIDTDTNEVISKTPVKKRRNTSNYFKKGEFSTVHKSLNKMLKTKKDYSNLTFRLLFELLDRVEFNNRIGTFRQAELAEILESHQQNISTSLRVLEKDEVIKKLNHDYYFTPKFIRYVNDGNFAHLHEESGT